MDGDILQTLYDFSVELRSRIERNVVIVELSGRVTVSDRPGLLKETIVNALSKGAKNVVIDLTSVHYIDSTRLGELISAHVTVSRQGGRLKLVHTPDRVTELLVIAGLSDVFERFPTVAEAIRSLED
jgi:anti-anti-sigma factor